MVLYRNALCPTCQKKGIFHCTGTQEWPRIVAEAHGLPTRMTLWTCPNCHTTVTDNTLWPSKYSRVPA